MTQTILTVLLIITMVATLGALAFGMVTLFRGGEFSQKYGNQAMRWRIILQGLALILFFLALWFGR
jgi:hypothetical protein